MNKFPTVNRLERELSNMLRKSKKGLGRAAEEWSEGGHDAAIKAVRLEDVLKRRRMGFQARLKIKEDRVKKGQEPLSVVEYYGRIFSGLAAKKRRAAKAKAQN